MPSDTEDDANKLAADRERLSFDREKWVVDQRLAEERLKIEIAEQRIREEDIILKRKEQARSQWWNPLVVAIFAAALAAIGNAVVSIINGIESRRVEDTKGEEARILEMIKTGSIETAKTNLRFLLDSGLIENLERANKIQNYLKTQPTDTGPVLPAPSESDRRVSSDAVGVDTLPLSDQLRQAGSAVGEVTIAMRDGSTGSCTAFFVAKDLVLTAKHCLTGMQPGNPVQSLQLALTNGGPIARYAVVLPPLAIGNSEQNFALLKVPGVADRPHAVLKLSQDAPRGGQRLATIYYRFGIERQLAVSNLRCQVVNVAAEVFEHTCETGAGTSGAPLLDSNGTSVVGLHYAGGLTPFGGTNRAFRADVIRTAIANFLAPNDGAK